MHSKALVNIKVLNQKLEEKDIVANSNKILRTKINEKDKEICNVLMKLDKISDLHKDILLKIKEYDHEIDELKANITVRKIKG